MRLTLFFCSLGLGRRGNKCVIKDVVPGGNGERAGFMVSLETN